MTWKDRLTNPCTQRWAELLPRGEGRYCGQCDTTVIDLSRLTKREALERARDGACVRARLDERGEPMFRPDPERRLGRRALAVVAALAGGCASPSAPVDPRPEATISASDPTPLPSGVALEELEPAALEALTDPAVGAEEDAGPTPEQIELTRQKRAARRPAPPTPPIPPHPEYLGGLMPGDF